MQISDEMRRKIKAGRQLAEKRRAQKKAPLDPEERSQALRRAWEKEQASREGK